ncbi:hypothetical protein PilKf_00465 [Pillotina sp. SPG140]|jgi:flagellar biosynthesis GTPase FlhF
MSSRVKTRTPFLNKAILLQALNAVGCKYTEQGGEILTQRTDWLGKQRFIFQDGRYFFQHDEGQYGLRDIGTAGHKSVHSFLGAVEKEYQQIIAKIEAAERERERIEREYQQAVAKREAERQERERIEREYQQAIAKREAERQERERIEREYQQAIAKIEAAKRERERIEQERREYVAKQKAAIIAKAKAQGYDVREETVQETVKLVLVRNTY